MPLSSATDTTITSALFVDFDNIYIGLRKSDPDAAERFASNPSRWLSWFEQGMPSRNGESKTKQRQVLIRRCYPNPDTGFRRYRSFFTSAAFTVIDCPALTQVGKNSADIHMVMDILDTLSHSTHFDEFVILSGDSDFMPVLLRLRAHKRKTMTVSIGMLPAAYRAACDLLISEEEFIESALGLSMDRRLEDFEPARDYQAVATRDSILNTMATHIFDIVSAEDEILPPRLPHALKEFREFRSSNDWMGLGSSFALAENFAKREPRLQFVKTGPADYKIILNPLSTQEEEDFDSLSEQIVASVRRIVGESKEPLTLARVSGLVKKELGDSVLTTRWAGTGSFKRLLQTFPDLGLTITILPQPGYIFDPARHPNPMQEAGLSRSTGTPLLESAFQSEDQPLTKLDEFMRRVSQVSGIPSLSSRTYALVFQGVAEELGHVAVGDRSYNTYSSSQIVSQWLRAKNLDISASDIAFVFKGLIFQDGSRFGTDPGSYTAIQVANIFRNNVLALCQRAQFELSEYECQLLDDWLLGEVEGATQNSSLSGEREEVGDIDTGEAPLYSV